MKINYELVYKLRKFNTDSLSNIQSRLRSKADEEAAKIHKQYTDALRQLLGHEHFEISHYSCLADQIAVHVFVSDNPENPTPIKGIGKRVCIYCGCDDFDD